MNNKTILCIDDDPFYRDLFKAILEPKGFTVLSALNPADGWDLLTQHHPALVTLDVMMPESAGIMDGYGFLKRVRADEKIKSTSILMISALGDAEDAKHGLELGANDYLPKQNMTPDILLEQIRKLIG